MSQSLFNTAPKTPQTRGSSSHASVAAVRFLVVVFGFEVGRSARCSVSVSIKAVGVFGARDGTRLRVLGSLGWLRVQSGTESGSESRDLAWLNRFAATASLSSGIAHTIFKVAS